MCMEHVTISKGNIKVGSIMSVSLPPRITCIHCGCWDTCYAVGMCMRFKSVKESYEKNLRILMDNPEQYWREVESVIMRERFFRYHVSGDILNYEYFENMVDIARRNPHCEQLCFTKKYAIVNKYIEENGELPSNLHIIFSAWRDLEMVNPHNLPECHIRYLDGTTTGSAGAIPCGGNCETCAITSKGCFGVSKGQQISIEEHGVLAVSAYKRSLKK